MYECIMTVSGPALDGKYRAMMVLPEYVRKGKWAGCIYFAPRESMALAQADADVIRDMKPTT